MEEPISTADPGDFDSATEEFHDAQAEEPVESASEATNTAEGAYWRENIRLLVTLMTIWFVSSFGAGILFRDFLDQFSLGGYPLGFWFAQQGSIYIFIALIFFYVFKMRKIERKYDLDD